MVGRAVQYRAQVYNQVVQSRAACNVIFGVMLTPTRRSVSVAQVLSALRTTPLTTDPTENKVQACRTSRHLPVGLVSGKGPNGSIRRSIWHDLGIIMITLTAAIDEAIDIFSSVSWRAERWL